MRCTQVSVFYVGKLKQGGKVFDKSTTGKGFSFRLGEAIITQPLRPSCQATPWRLHGMWHPSHHMTHMASTWGRRMSAFCAAHFDRPACAERWPQQAWFAPASSPDHGQGACIKSHMLGSKRQQHDGACGGLRTRCLLLPLRGQRWRVRSRVCPHLTSPPGESPRPMCMHGCQMLPLPHACLAARVAAWLQAWAR